MRPLALSRTNPGTEPHEQVALKASNTQARSAAIIRTWFSSSVDVAWRTQREIPRVRLIAASWILLGGGFTIYGLVTGR